MASPPLSVPLRFTAHVLIKPEGAEKLPRAYRSVGQVRWHMPFDIYAGHSRPPSTLGERSDIFFDGQSAIYIKRHHGWTQWTKSRVISWPQDPNNPIPITQNHILYYLGRCGNAPPRGLAWARPTIPRRIHRNAGSVQEYSISDCIKHTISFWRAWYKRLPGTSGQSGDIERIALEYKLEKPEEEAAQAEGGNEEGTEDVKPCLAQKKDNRWQGSSRKIKAEVLKTRCAYFAL